MKAALNGVPPFSARDGWVRVMRYSIALTGSFFNAHRMVRQYIAYAYALGAGS